MGVNLSSGAISKIMSGNCTENDLQPVLQVTYIDHSRLPRSKHDKQWFWVGLSDGSYREFGLLAYKFYTSHKLEKGSILQLTKFLPTKLTKPLTTDKGEILTESAIRVWNYALLHSKCDIIGHPKPYPLNETPKVERTKPTIPDEDHIEEPPTSKQNPSTSTQKCSSHSPTQNKKRKLQSSNDDISGFGKDDVGACFKKLETLEENVSILTRMVMEKNKEDVVGLKKLETLEQDVSKLTTMMMEKNKEDDMGACIEKLDKMGWGAEEPIFETALLLFGQSADYRKLWLHLKPECCGKWVKNAGNMFGLLD